MTSLNPSTLEERIFKISLLASLCFHLLLFVFFIYGGMRHDKKRVKNYEIIYQIEAREVEKRFRSAEKVSPSLQEQHRKFLPSPDLLARKEVATLPQVKGVEKQERRATEFNKPVVPLKDLEGKRRIVVPVLESEKITNPKYLSYHERIREKIKNRAYFYVDDPRFEAGEVYLTFVIKANGSLGDVQIINHRTIANNFLRGVGLRSIKESDPFPAFPEELLYPELTFNVVISFKME